VLSRARRHLQANTSRRINDPVPDTDGHPRRYAIVGLCLGELTETFKEKRFYWHNHSHSAGSWRWRQTALKKEWVSLRGVYVWDVNSTVTKYSDYFVWKDTSERVTRRLDDTSWQEVSEILCIKTPPFSRVFSNKKIIQKPPEMLPPTRYWCHVNWFRAKGSEKLFTSLSINRRAVVWDTESLVSQKAIELKF